MDRLNYNSYWFDFGDTVNEQLPLTYDTLKLCKQKINITRAANNSVDLGSKLNPIKLVISFEEKHSNNNTNIKQPSLNSLYSSDTINSTFILRLKSKLYNIINLVILKPVVSIIEFKYKISSIKLNIDHYYLINGKLYITYKDSFMLFNSTDEYIRGISEINNAKTFFLYRNFNVNNIKLTKLLDYIFIRIILFLHLVYLKSISNNRFNFRLKQTNWGFYINNQNNISNILSGLNYIWLNLRFWLISVIMGLSCMYYLVYIRLLPLNKVIFTWILVTMFLYWLISGFVFFIKKYQYSKYTSAIQRFWKRTYILFWIIEAGTFSVFFYLTLNASTEPVYMYDQIKIYKTHLFSWRWFLIKLLPSVSIILLGYYLQLTLKWNLFNKQSTILILITLLLLYILWLEFYQFFHILSFFGNINWVFDYDEYIWSLEIDAKRTRLSNNYISVCLFAKFWHFVFIFIFWVFFVLRVNELGRIRYNLLVANLQNFIIIYIMSWVYMYPWVKFVFRKYLDIPYYWFYLNGREIGIRVFFTDLKLFFFGLSDRFLNYNTFYIRVERFPFFYWINSSFLTNFDQYRKFIIRDVIIYNLNNYIL